MTWPVLPDSTVVADVLGRTVVFGQRSGVLVTVDDIGRFVLEHRHHFVDHGDAEGALTELLAADPAEVETGLRVLEAALDDLAADDSSPFTHVRGRPLEPPAGRSSARWSIDVLGTPVEVRCHDDRLVDVVEPLLAAHKPAHRPGVHRFDVWDEDDGLVSVARDGAAMYERVDVDVAVNGLIAGMTVLAILAPRHMIALHAAGLSDGGRAVLLGGGSGAGKSTTSIELTAQGWTFLTDEVVELDPQSGVVTGLPRPIGLEGPARGWRPELRPAWWTSRQELYRWPVPPAAIGDVGERATVGLIAHLEFDGSDPALVEPLEPLEALGRLCAMTYNRDVLTADRLATLGDLMTGVPSVVVRHDGARHAATALATNWDDLQRIVDG